MKPGKRIASVSSMWEEIDRLRTEVQRLKEELSAYPADPYACIHAIEHQKIYCRQVSHDAKLYVEVERLRKENKKLRGGSTNGK